MTPYDRICADVHSAIDDKAVKGIIEDLYQWTTNSNPQYIEGRLSLADADWTNAKCSMSISDRDDRNNFSPSLTSAIQLESKDKQLSVLFAATTGSDDYTREIGHIVEVLIESYQQLPEAVLDGLGSAPTLGQLIPLPDDLSDYADFHFAIENQTSVDGKIILSGFVPVKDI